MPDLRTEITEIVTGLGMLGLPGLGYALERRPGAIAHVGTAAWDGLREAWRAGTHTSLFDSAWANGEAFLSADQGLRNRIPRSIEWKGAHRPPAYEQVPADLRVDHVFLVSCKYQSRILFNPSPAHLFDRCLSDRAGEAGGDWYMTVAPEAYRAFYTSVATTLDDLPEQVTQLLPTHRQRLKETLGRRWPEGLQEPYRMFCEAVSTATARRWKSHVTSPEPMLWRLLRLYGAPYFLLGDSDSGPLRLRVYTPWDWRSRYRLEGFEVTADASAGQPQVRWAAAVHDRESTLSETVRGHVEIRWSHGRFCGQPESKVYLDTPHHAVPGYESIC
ncbi:MAG TPA: hypothetical protein VGO93_09455 [Candidatus Xenobia bacterium]|jgi:hypothetical protein